MARRWPNGVREYQRDIIAAGTLRKCVAMCRYLTTNSATSIKVTSAIATIPLNAEKRCIASPKSALIRALVISAMFTESPTYCSSTDENAAIAVIYIHPMHMPGIDAGRAIREKAAHDVTPNSLLTFHMSSVAAGKAAAVISTPNGRMLEARQIYKEASVNLNPPDTSPNEMFLIITGNTAAGERGGGGIYCSSGVSG